MLDESKVGLTRVMRTNLLNNIRYIGPSECKVLKSTSYTSVMSGVSYQRTISRKFGTSINQSEARFAVCHASAFKNFKHIMSLTMELGLLLIFILSEAVDGSLGISDGCLRIDHGLSCSGFKGRDLRHSGISVGIRHGDDLEGRGNVPGAGRVTARGRSVAGSTM